MQDLFNDIMAHQESEKSKSSEKTNNKDDLAGISVKETISIPSTSKSSETSAKKGSRDKHLSKSGTQESIDKLSEIMTSGFQNLQLLLGGCIRDDYECENDEMPEDLVNCQQVEEADLFQEVSQDFLENDKIGADVVSSLASLANNVLSKKLETTNEIFKKYPKPGNVEFVNTPQINKPVWNGLPHTTKGNDVILQSIQKDFLHSALPILTVMQQLNEARENPAALDVKDLVRNLADGLAFLGSANVGMVRYRRASVKKDLPHNMQLLCSDSVEFSGTNLFGNSLSSDIKEVSELNKITQSMRGSFRGFRSRYRGFPRVMRGRQPYFRSSMRGRVTKPYASTHRRTVPNHRFPLNRGRPSRQ